MNHSFNVDIAIKYGIEEAIILENMFFWLEKNRANKKHIINSQVWTYNTQAALSKLFPYMNRSKIQRVMSKLEKENLIIRANHNEAKYDRTTWYALTPRGYSLFNINNGLCNLNSPLCNLDNPISQSEQPIPDINTDINTDINIKKKKTEFDELIESYTANINLRKNIYEFIKMRKGIKASITTLGLKKMLNKLDTLTTNNNEKIAILDNSIMNSWKGIFPLNNKSKNITKNEKAPLRFNNFEARDYYANNEAMNDLEKKLLGWDNEN
ncbi:MULTISPECIES: hypothetical protein [Clostridium]|uniref:hypothetical protein n=1 Tax=Clostridium TaxID=1485 RepID=UPI000773A425|nr:MULTISPECIES: hypothetical protein [Clostridium]NFN09373.1 hypothetical protein [Clostridium botulinum]NFN32947.1 hypothetical protein [Clostridium botulinum]